MSENKFTPGPWAIHEDEWVGIEVRSANAADLAEAPAYYVLASSIGGHRYGQEFTDDSEVRANAALIAAAPDLLEALEYALSMWGDYLPPGNSNAMKAIKQARSAIAKAKGE